MSQDNLVLEAQEPAGLLTAAGDGTFCPNILSDDSSVEMIWHSYIEAQEKILNEIDRANLDTPSKLQRKLDVMETYVAQLKEQNDVLMKTGSELEREAQMRVTQMETRLKTSAKATKEVVLQLYEYEKMFSRITEEKLDREAELQEVVHQQSTLRVENSFLRDQNANLKHDLHALLQVVQQARSTGQWLMDCVTFCELTPDEVFGPVCSYSRSAQAEDSSLFSHSERSSSCNSSYSNLVEAEQGLAKRTDLDLTLRELQHQNRHLQKLREQAQLEFLDRDRSIAELESQITSLNYQLDILRMECDRNRLTMGFSSPQLLALPSPPSETGSTEERALNKTVTTNDSCTQTEERNENHLKDTDFVQEIRKWEERVEAKEVLLRQLQSHLQTSFTEVELKDTALSNAEHKLTSCRLECAQLREDKSQLQQELQEANALSLNFQQNVFLREQEIQEYKSDRQTWNEQKQNLMIMCDEQNEKIFNFEEEIALQRAQIRVHTAEVSLQKVTIQNLQEALIRNTKVASSDLDTAQRTLSQNSIHDI